MSLPVPSLQCILPRQTVKTKLPHSSCPLIVPCSAGGLVERPVWLSVVLVQGSVVSDGGC